jgi:hypothetical protein
MNDSIILKPIPRIMDGFEICLCTTDMNEKTIEKFSKIIRKFGGVMSNNELKETTACLVTKTVKSSQFKKAQRYKNIHCVTTEWLTDSEKNGKTMNFDSYKVQPFLGLIMSCTDVPQSDRPKFVEMVTKNGGKFSPTLVEHYSTHLIQGQNNGNVSEKYKSARLWGLHIISPRWIYDCIRQESKYHNSLAMLR